jgi:hypothetical protein
MYWFTPNLKLYFYLGLYNNKTNDLQDARLQHNFADGLAPSAETIYMHTIGFLSQSVDTP